MPELTPTDVDAALVRLFALLGVAVPMEGSVVFDFHESRVMKVRPTVVITVRRGKESPSSQKGIAPEKNSAHTQQR